jgi:sensor histidine kinase YesM
MDAYGVFIAEFGSVQLWNLLFIIAISVFAVLMLLSSVGSITRPLVRLSGMAAELSAGNFGIDDLEASSVREMDQLVHAFNRMKHDLSQYIEEIRRQETIKQEYMRERMRNMKMEGLVRHMEIYALQAQMNPHFLFNTLNTGMQLAIVEGADRTGEYMEYTAKLFRHIIRNKEIVVPLRHEIEGLNYYFYLLRVRFPKNLDLVLDYEEDLLDKYKTPVSILQPLVENCIIHAFREEPAEGIKETRRIIVRAALEGEFLVLSVADNGSGMAAETREKLLHPQSIDQSSLSRVMGLENVIQRLYFFYPDDPGIVDIVTKDGTTIIIRIDTGREPCIKF